MAFQKEMKIKRVFVHFARKGKTVSKRRGNGKKEESMGVVSIPFLFRSKTILSFVSFLFLSCRRFYNERYVINNV